MAVDESETKRPRLESSGDNVDGSAPQNEQLEEEKKEDETLDVQFLDCLEPVKATAETTTEEPASNDNDKTDLGSAEEPEQPNGESEKELSNITREDSAEGQTGSDTQILSRKMEIPDDMVGVLKDKAEDTVLSPLDNLGAKILVGHADANPLSTGRHFELVGISESISKARMIKNLIAKDDAGGSPSLVARGFSTDQAASASEQREVSFENGGVRIGKARYTIQCLLDNTFAKIQILSDADKVELFGTLENIKWTERLIKDVIAKADAGGSPSLVSQGFSSDQAASAGEQREVSVQKADAGGSPKLDAPLFRTDQVANVGEQPVFCYEKADDGGSPALVSQGFSSDQATSAGEQREVSVEKADDGGSPRSVPAILQSDHAAYVCDDRPFVCFDKNSSVLSELSKPHPSASAQSSACRVDKYAHLYLEIDKYGGYHVSTFPEEIPSEYHIERVERQLYGLRKFRVQKDGESTFDIVMVGCLNIYKYNTWIAGDTITFEEPDYANKTPVLLPPLALSFPTNMTVEEYKREHEYSYKKMLKGRLTSAMKISGYDPADYGVDDDLCLSVIGDSVPRKIILAADEYPCECCGGACTCSDSEWW